MTNFHNHCQNYDFFFIILGYRHTAFVLNVKCARHIRGTEQKADGLENISTVPNLVVHFMQSLRQFEDN
jgi:hypothetical protein